MVTPKKFWVYFAPGIFGSPRQNLAWGRWGVKGLKTGQVLGQNGGQDLP
jgi:uncharacterized membrane protein